MRFFLTCSIKQPMTLIEGKTKHDHGELRHVELKEGRLETLAAWRIEENGHHPLPGHRKLNGGILRGDFFYATTFSRVIRINLADGSQEELVSTPRFNDLHHVGEHEGRFAVCNTGLERLEIYDSAFRPLEEYDLLAQLGQPKSFDPGTDYRLLWDTKPHGVHANHAFFWDGEWWVTRFIQQDCIGMVSGRRIDVSAAGNPHDGLLRDGAVFFTTTNGRVLRHKLDSGKQRVWDLCRMLGVKQIGWCRGLEVVGSRAWVCFTRLRSSIYRGMQRWVRTGSLQLPSQIIELDLRNGKVLNTYSVPEADLTMFSLVASP